MATFETKFNLGDTVYYVDEEALKLISGTVGSILVRQDLSRGAAAAPAVKYLLREKPVPIEESILMTLLEAQTQMAILLTEKQSEINSL